MNAEYRKQPPGFPMRPPGTGHALSWRCMGCDQVRGTTRGSRGLGIAKRCAKCVEAKT